MSENKRNCFQNIKDVFVEPEQKDLVFFPLCTVNLKEVIPDRNEWVHFVDIWNNGNPEEFTFGENLTRDSITFELKDSKYYFFGDLKAFPKFSKLASWRKESIEEFNANKEEYIEIPSPDEFEKSDRYQKELEREDIDFDYYLYIDHSISYLVNKERFNRNGKLTTHKSFPKGHKFKEYKPIEQIGGQPQWEQKDMTPKDVNGKPLTFIGQVTGFNYVQNGSDNIYLFLNEKTNEIVQIFQYG